jgi:PST family polysaccharide transporter
MSTATVVLARLLKPADFGLVAMVTAITSLGTAFADLGLSEATIQRKEITHDQVSTLFWVNLAIGLGLMAITLALAPVLAWFYKEPRLKDITFLLSLTFLISGLRVQHDALLKRQMRFKSLAVRDIAAYCVAVPAAIAMAFRGFGYWAIVALPLILNSTAMALSWLMVRWRPGIPRRGANVRSMIAFGGNVAASYLVLNLSRNTDNVLIGWYWGAGPLGFYSRAYNLLALPVRQLSGPAGSVAVPGFSRIVGDPERFARYYLRTVNLMTWMGAPVFAYLFVAAQPVIILTLGHQWQQAAPVFQMLAICALGQLLFEPIIWMFISRGESGRLLKLLLLTSPLIVLSFLIGLPFGIKGVALSGSLALVALFPWMLKFSFRGTDLTLRRMGRAILYPISISLIAIGFAKVALNFIAPQRVIAQLMVVAVAFAAAYSISLFIPAVRREIWALRQLWVKSESSEAPAAAARGGREDAVRRRADCPPVIAPGINVKVTEVEV